VGDGSGLQGINSDSGSWVNGTDVVYLSTIGDKVGIGVNPPLHKLDVDGDINFTGALKINGTAAVFSNWTVSGSDIYRSTGNVGIGTTGPIAALDIDGGPENDTVPALSIRGGLFSESDLYVLNTYSNSTAGGVGYAAKVIGVNIKNKVETDNKIQIRSNSGGLTCGSAMYLGSDDSISGVFGILTGEGAVGTTLTEKLTVRASGNVGIGMIDPGAKLDVNGDIAVGGGGALRRTVDNDIINIYAGSDNTNPYMFMTGKNRLSNANKIGFRIAGDDKLSMLSDKIYTDSSVNVGIGTATVDSGIKLQVNGVVKATGFTASTGNVGIGTNSPDGKLHIYETTGTSHGIQVGTLILEHGNSGGSSSIVFPSKVNITSDYGYITYNENYGEAGISATTENGVLLLGAENDGTGSSDHVRIKTRLVVEADMAGSDPTYAFQVKSSNTTSDLFAVHRGGSIGINGIDQAVPFTINSNKTATISGTTYTTYCKWYRGSGNWWTGSDNNTTWNQNLYWFANTGDSGNPLKKVIVFENDQSKGTGVNLNTFTGQHRNIVRGVNPTNIETFIGLIVSADNNENIKVNGGVERGLDAITINETIPLVSVTNKAYDKSVFGVVSGSEDPEYREDKFGRVTSVFIKEEGDDRIFINSLGEGAMWISNQNGPLTSGDYVTSSHIPGYGMKQDSEFLANYTVAKITMNCDFQVTPHIKYKIKSEFKTVNYYRHEDNFIKESDYNKLEQDTQSEYTREQYDENVNILDEHGQLQWEDSGETEAPYKLRYLLPDGTQISKEEYTTRALANEEVYLAAFVGCTYHCG
jgi:hypothetical protein